nr:beta-methylgalactoside transporter [Clostridia bacterium]
MGDNVSVNDGIFKKILHPLKKRFDDFRQLEPRDKLKRISALILDNAMLIIIVTAIIVIAILRPRFLSVASVINIISLTAARLPIALGIGGAIVLTGTDISAGRAVGLTACISASLLQSSGYLGKMFPNLSPLPPILVLLIVMLVGAVIGLINGFFVAKFKLHPFIVTLSTQLILFGAVLLYLQIGDNGGQTLSGLDRSYIDFVTAPLFKISGIAVPRYILFALIITALMWVIWNKTVFGKNMFAVGSNEAAATVSGVNVFLTIIGVFVLAGALYGVTGFIEGARIASSASYTGQGYESDAIAACVIGGVSFVGGTGKISGIVIGVLLLQIIFVGLNFLSVDQNMLYIIKGLIILLACAVDMRKYLKKR